MTNRIVKAGPNLDWGIDYASSPSVGTIMLNDFTPWPAAKLEEFMVTGDKQEPRGKPPASIYLVNASMGKHNIFFGSVYGDEHIPERENASGIEQTT